MYIIGYSFKRFNFDNEINISIRINLFYEVYIIYIVLEN